MKKQFNLSNEITCNGNLPVEKVKEFIKRLKKECENKGIMSVDIKVIDLDDLNEIINNLTGEGLR